MITLSENSLLHSSFALASNGQIHQSRPELVIADGHAQDIHSLLNGMDLPLITLDLSKDPVRDISLALAGETLDVLHIVAHGQRERFSLGGTWVDAAALRAQSALVAGWKVQKIVLWSCAVGADSELVATLRSLTGAQVFASDEPLGLVNGQRHWSLGAEAPCTPFAPQVLANWDHQLANYSFSRVYAVTSTVDKESNNHTFNTTPLAGGIGGAISDGVSSRLFSGNDVSATLNIQGLSPVYGWISRPIKVGGVVVGFYMWTDANFTSLALAQADGNADADSSTTDNSGYILVVPGKESYFTSGSIGSSSDRVDSALNSLVPVNAAPVAYNDTATISEDGSGSGTVITNDTDPNGDTLVVTQFTYTVGGVTSTVAVSSGTAGSATISGVGIFTLASSGAWTFTPVSNYNGPVPTITYTIADPSGLTSSATLSMSVTPVNDPPTVTAITGAPAGSADWVTTPQNTPIVLGLNDFGQFTDVDAGNTLQKIQITTLATNGVLQYYNGTSWAAVTALQEITAADIVAGKLRFAPDANENGSPYATLTFKVSDGTAWSTSAYTVTYNVTPVNQAPVANNDNAPVSGVYAAFSVESGCHVTGTDQAGVTLTNAGSNQSGNVLTNDTDVDTGTTLHVTQASSTVANDVKTVASGSTSTSNYVTVSGLYGSLRVGADGSYIYLPDNSNSRVQALRPGDVLTESFAYTVSDGSGGTATASLTAVIKGSNDAPDAIDDYDTVQERALSGGNYGTATGNVITNDTDPDTSPTLTIASSNAAATGSSSGTATYTLTASSSIGVGDYVFWDSDSSASNGSLGTTIIALTVSGNPVRVASKDGSGNVTLNYPNALLSNDQGIVFSATGANQYVGFSPNANSSGNYKVSQFQGTNSPSSATINLTGITGAVSVGMTVTDGSTTKTVTGITTDANGTITSVTLDSAVTWTAASLSFSAAVGTTLTGKYGTLVFGADGSYTYTLTSNALNDNQSFVESFAYTLSDGTCTDSAVLYITANGTTAVTMVDDTAVVLEDSGSYVSGVSNVLSNDTLAGGTLASFAWGGQSASAGQTLTIAGVGTLNIAAAGTYTFDPVDNYTGPVPVAIYTLSSGAAATLQLTIQAVNDLPTVSASTDAPSGSVDLVTTPEDTPIVLATTDFGKFTDVDTGDTLQKIQITTLPNHGTLQYYDGTSWVAVTSNQEVTVSDIVAGKLRFVPAADENGNAYTTIGFKVSDGTGYSASAYTVTVNVTPVNDPPVNTVPATQVLNSTPTTAFTTNLALNGVSVADVEDSLTSVTLSVSYGTLQATAGAGVTLSGAGTSTLTLTGSSVTQVNAVLATLQYTANTLFSGNDRLVVNTLDSGGLRDVDSVTITVNADDRPLTVTGSTVNEASPYLLFTVAGVAGQYVKLAAANATATLGLDALPNLQYYDGSAWQTYTAGSYIALPQTTTSVRLPVLQDNINEGSETLSLTAYNQAATAHDGTGTIKDDGTGSVFLAAATNLTPSTYTDPLDDDRPLTVTDPNDVSLNGIVVNEGSVYGVLKVSGQAGQSVQLSLLNGTAVDADHGLITANSGTTQVEVYNGSGWVPNTTGQWVTLTGSSMLVRIKITNDSTYEGPETFGLLATNTGGQSTSGTVVIMDNGTGNNYPDNTTGAVDNTVTLDNDLTISVTGYGPVNEGSTYAMFTVQASKGMPVLLSVAGSGSTQATVTGFTLQYSTDGTNWSNYNEGSPPLVPGTVGAGTDTFYVRVNISSESDAVLETSETFSLTGTVSAGGTPAKTSSAEVAIVDVGNGTRYTGTVTNGIPVENTSGVNDNDSNIGVSNPVVNEASPYAVFSVTATAGSTLGLAIHEEAGIGHANIDELQPIQYWDAGTSQWVNYSTSVVMPAGGTLLVRVNIQAEQDSPPVDEPDETFELLVTLGGITAVGTATIVDNGNGTLYPNANPTNSTTPVTDTTPTHLDDDRPLLINSIRVNEGSTHAVFEVTGAAGQLASLTLANGTALGGVTTPADGSVDYGTAVEYWDGNAWQAYTASSFVAVPSGGVLKVRMAIVNDNALEGDQNFTLTASNTSGASVTGTATIDDTGGGVMFTFDPSTQAPTGTSTTGLNNDTPPPAPAPVASPPPPPFTANLDPVKDTGDLDNITRITDPEFTLNGGNYLQPGRTARLVDPTGTVIGSAPVMANDVTTGKVNVPTGQLDDGTYTYQAQILDDQGKVVASAPVTVTIVTDRDGVMPSVELAANGGDYNHDGIADWEQNNVAQLPVTSYEAFVQGKTAPASSFGAIMAGVPDPSKPAGVALDSQAQLIDISVQPVPNVPLPKGTSTVSAMYNFSVSSVTGGQLVDVNVRPGLQTQTVIDIPQGIQANAYLKFNAQTQSWTDFTNPAAIYGLVDGATLLDTNHDGKVDRIVLTLTDGGPGDEDGVVNGTIVDPGVLAIVGPVITGPSGGSGAAASEKTIPENTLPVTRFQANEPVTWKITSGSDKDLFTIYSDGQLQFKAKPDYELPLDVDHNNSYLLQIEATNSAGGVSTQTVTVYVTNVGIPVYYAVSGSADDRTLSLTPATPQQSAQVQFYVADSGTQGTVPLKAWQNILTGDWFYGRADVTPPYACYVEHPEIVLGRVLPAGQGAFDVHTYLNANGVTQIMGVAAADKLGLLSHGYVDLGSAYVFASADDLPAVSIVGVSA